ncbi:MAG: sigma factor-like helix-turn-helix DNA-binding protein [Bacillota bacterium]|nr:sigma factor-like helix-turn-helix DNA-binding protein [Bacillota bacterium]
MFKKFKTNGITTTIEISEEGKVTYAVGKKKTTFDLSECDSFTYEFEATNEKVEITEEMITETEGVEPWLWLVISKGEERIEYNNNQTESRRHHSYSDQNDKFDTLMAEEDALDMVLVNLEKEALRDAIQTLEPQQQELVMDLYYREIPVAHIAKRDGVDEAAIRNRRKRILKKIKKSLF